MQKVRSLIAVALVSGGLAVLTTTGCGSDSNQPAGSSGTGGGSAAAGATGAAGMHGTAGAGGAAGTHGTAGASGAAGAA